MWRLETGAPLDIDTLETVKGDARSRCLGENKGDYIELYSVVM